MSRLRRYMGRYEHLRTRRTVRAEEVTRGHSKRLRGTGDAHPADVTLFPLTVGDVLITDEDTGAQAVRRRGAFDLEFACLGS